MRRWARDARWLIALVLLALPWTIAVTSAQSPRALTPTGDSGYADLVARATGAYGVDVRGTVDGARVDARVGTDTALDDAHRRAEIRATRRQPLTVAWSATNVRLTLDGQSLTHAAAWQIGNAIRISARGRARVKVASAGGKKVDKTIDANDLIVAGPHLSRGWTLDATIEWPAMPTPTDAVIVTAGQQDLSKRADSDANRLTFQGGTSELDAFTRPGQPAPPGQRNARIVEGTTRTWTGDESSSWNEPLNWNPVGVPNDGDRLVFPGRANRTNTENNIASPPQLGGITVQDNGYQIQGQGLVLAQNSTSVIERDFGVDSLAGGGSISILGNTSFNVGRSKTSPLPVTFVGTIAGASARLVKEGLGVFTFAGNAAGIEATEVREGHFRLFGGVLSAVTVTESGTVFAMRDGQTGRLTVERRSVFGEDDARGGRTGNFQLDDADYVQPLGGADDYQKVVVTGAVGIRGRSELHVRLVNGYLPSAGTTFIMVDNDGTDPVDGTFDNLPEGAIVDLVGVTFRISYVAGTGNDIGLTVVDPITDDRRDLEITKTISGPFVAGQIGTFIISVRNVGTARWTGRVFVTDTLPTGYVPVSVSGIGWGCNITGQDVFCSRTTELQVLEPYPDIRIDVQIAQTAQDAINRATVNGAGDHNPSNDQSEVAIVVGRSIDLAVSKSHTGTFQQGGTGTFQIVVSNVGQTASNGLVTVTDTLPTGLTPTSAAGPGWTCNIAAPTVTCTRSDALGAGAAFGAIALGVTIAATAPASVTNTATLTGGGDIVPANNTATDVVAIAPLPPPIPDLTIQKTQVNAPFTQGQTGGQFTITVSNGGPGPTSGAVTVSDVLQAGLTPTSAAGAGWVCNVTAPSVSCARSDALPAGQAYPAITITVNVAPSAATLTNTATISGGGDTSPANNSVTIPVGISVPAPVPDLSVQKTHTGEVAQGGSVTFQITVRNLSSAATAGEVVVSDPVPAGLSAQSASGAGWTCDLAPIVTCRRSDSLAAGGVYPIITLTAAVSATATSGANTVTVSGGGDASVGNNSATDPYSVATRTGDLTITKTHTGDFTPGQNATFTITVNNVGPVPTSGTVTVTDALPGGLTFVSASGTGWVCQITTPPASCSRSDALGTGGSYPAITLVAAVAPTAQSAENLAVVAGGGDTNTANNTARDPFVVLGVPNLTITKSHTGNFVVGQTDATYQILVRNAGAATTTGAVHVDDPLPAGLTPVSAGGTGWTCSVAGQAVACERSDSLATQQTWPAITITVSVGQFTGSTTNIATVSGGGDVRPEDNSAADPTIVVGRPQVTVIKTHSTPVLQGDRDLPFTITVTNNGTATTVGLVTVTDTLPAGLTPTDAAGGGWTCGIAARVITCSRSDTLAAGADFPSIQVRADVAADAFTGVNNVVVAGGGDSTPVDNVFQDPVPITPVGQPNVLITKRHDADFAPGQTNAVYFVRVVNVGTQPTAGEIVVSDDLPGGFTPVSAIGIGWSCSIGGQHVECRRSDALAADRAFPEVSIVVSVSDSATDATNVATVSGGGDTTPGDNTASDPTHVLPHTPDLMITKQHADPFLQSQADAAYRITVSNVGAGPTTAEVVVVDNVPTGLTPVSASGAGWTCGFSGQTVTCRRSDALAPGASYPVITLVVQVAPNAANLTNVAAVTTPGDTNPANNVDGDATNINVSPDPTIALSLGSPLYVSTIAEFHTVVTNLGPGWQGGETRVVATFPGELLPVAADGPGWVCSKSGQQLSCDRAGPLGPDEKFPQIRYRVFVRLGPTGITVSARVSNDADANLNNNEAILTAEISLPTTELQIVQRTSTPRVGIGGVAGYQIEAINSGQVRLARVVIRDLLPRGFILVEATRDARSSQHNARTQAVTVDGATLVWPIDTLAPGETVTLTFSAIVGADARTGPQDSRATIEGVGLADQVVQAGPAIATVEVVADAFSMLQSIVGRVFEDTDGNGMFGGGDRPIENARVITSTGQAALTDAAGMYNIPSIGAGSVAVSLDRNTIPDGLTLTNGPGSGRSWTQLVRTPVGGGTLLSQSFALRPVSSGGARTAIPAGSGGAGVFIALGEVSFGRAAQEFEIFEKDSDVWGYGSLFYKGPVGSPKNQLTFALDSRRHLNRTTDRDRLFELDPNDRAYPVFGDGSRREELAMSNSKVYARFERGSSYFMYGDVNGDRPSSSHDGGLWSSYQRHLTGVEVRLGDAGDNHVTVRGAQPSTAYARDVIAGNAFGLVTLTHLDVLPGTDTVAIEVRDRRMPERLLSREVLTRFVDYQIEPRTGTVFLTKRVGTFDPTLNLVQLVVTYEYENQGVEHLVFNGRASGRMGSLRLGGSFFTEEGVDDRFTVVGVDLTQTLPRGGRLRVDLPYSHGTPNVGASVGTRPVDAGRDTNGIAVQSDVEQPFSWWNGVARGSFLHADADFRNPFSATVTPGATLAGGSAEFTPRTPSKLRVGGTYERYDTASVDAWRTAFSGEWAETIGKGVTLKGGYDARSLDQSGTRVDSGLFIGQALYKYGDRFEARAGREQNVRDAEDPTYPSQTMLGARLKLGPNAALFYTHRISDTAIVPVGDFNNTGISAVNTKNELNIGIESRVADRTQLTSQYRIENGINGPDAFAVIGVLTQVKAGRGVGLTFGGERGQLVDGDGNSFTNGSFAVDWLASNRFKTTARYDGRHRDGYTGLLSAGAAARIAAGFTVLGRARWSASNDPLVSDAVSLLGAFALRPATHDRLGWLLSYQFLDREQPTPLVAPGRDFAGWRHLLSTDGYAQPLEWLGLHARIAWQRADAEGAFRTDTYLAQGRAQFSVSRYLDLAIEERYLRQTQSDSHRTGAATELGFWPLSEVRIAVGYSFQDTRDSYGRDLQGRDKGVYLTLSSKLSSLFDLFGSRPPAMATSATPRR